MGMDASTKIFLIVFGFFEFVLRLAVFAIIAVTIVGLFILLIVDVEIEDILHPILWSKLP